MKKVIILIVLLLCTQLLGCSLNVITDLQSTETGSGSEISAQDSVETENLSESAQDSEEKEGDQESSSEEEWIDIVFPRI